MIGLTSIGSGSKGNSSLLELGGKYYLLDAGFSCRRITCFLNERNIAIEDLSGVFITHEHDDHIKGLRVFLKKAPGLAIYSTKGTFNALEEKDLKIDNFVEVTPGKILDVCGCECLPFNISHDAAHPVGYRFEYNKKVLSVATDLGYVTPEVLDCSKDSDILCLESNYDNDMLSLCSYPGWLKNRIKGPMGHLPNEGVRGVLSKMNKAPESLVLMHLSQDSNTPDLARKALIPFLKNSGGMFEKTKIFVASQDFAGERICSGEE